MGCTSSTPTADAAKTDAAGRKHSRAPSFHAIGHAESRRDSSTADGESPAERRRRLRAERRTSTPAQRMNGKPPLASSANNNNTTNTNNNASSTANATKSHGASGSVSRNNFPTSFSASRNPLTHPPNDDDGDADLASAASSSAAHALPRTEVRQEHTPTTSQQLQQQQEQRQRSNTSPSQSLSASRRHVRHNAQGSDENYVPTSPAAAAVHGDGATNCRHAASHHNEPVVPSLPATPASLRYSSPHPSPAPNRTLGDLPGQPHRPPPATRQASSGRSFLTASGFFSTSDGAAHSGGS